MHLPRQSGEANAQEVLERVVEGGVSLDANSRLIAAVGDPGGRLSVLLTFPNSTSTE
jgi:hypothetical protein